MGAFFLPGLEEKTSLEYFRKAATTWKRLFSLIANIPGLYKSQKPSGTRT